jgi:hypothetical protein
MTKSYGSATAKSYGSATAKSYGSATAKSYGSAPLPAGHARVLLPLRDPEYEQPAGRGAGALPVPPQDQPRRVPRR